MKQITVSGDRREPQILRLDPGHHPDPGNGDRAFHTVKRGPCVHRHHVGHHPGGTAPNELMTKW